MSQIKNKAVLLGGAIMIIIPYLLTELDLFNSRFFSYESSLLEPVFFSGIAIFISSLFLLFFSDQIFQKWLRYVVSWYAPVAFLLILSGTTDSSYVWLPRVDIAIVTGIGLVIITIVFTLIQRIRTPA